MEREAIFKQCGKIIRPEVNKRLMGWLWKSRIFKSMDEGLFFYEIDNNQVIGFVTCERKARLKLIDLNKMGVAINYRNQGVGKKLMDQVKTLNSPIRLDVVKENTSAINFYLKNGFKIIGEKKLGKLDDINVIQMMFTEQNNFFTYE